MKNKEGHYPRLIILLFLIFTFHYSIGQPWYSRTYNITGGQEAAKALAINGDSIVVRATFVCDTTLCTVLGSFSQYENNFSKVQQHIGIQAGLKNIMQNDSFIFLSSEERSLNNNISVSKFDKFSFDLISYKDLRVDSSKYFSYVIGPSIKYIDKFIVSANVLDSLNFINYQGWYNYQEKTMLFVLDEELNTDTLLILPPSSGAFLKVEDMAVGPDSILYISFYEKYLKQGTQHLFLEIRKVVYGFNQKLQRVFQWIGPDFDVPESFTCLAIGEDSTVYFNYKHDFKTYVAALNQDASLKWECRFDSNPGAYAYQINRIQIAQNGDIIGTGVIASVVDELGESGFLFRLNDKGELLWKRAIRINKGLDETIQDIFPFRANLEDIIELPNGDLLATGWVRNFVGYDNANGPLDEDVWMVRTASDGCLWENCPYIQDIYYKKSYLPVVSSDNEWVVDFFTPSFPAMIYKYTFSEDSIWINTNYYHELLYATGMTGSWLPTHQYLREENGRIFKMGGLIGQEEKLLYDFNFMIGDTLPPHEDGSFNHREIIQTGIDTLLDGEPRKFLKLKCATDFGSDTTTWIEGIGDLERLFWTESFCSAIDGDGVITAIRCFSTNHQTIYLRPDLEGCYSTSTLEIEPGNFQILPNPTHGIFSIRFDNNPIAEQVQIYNSFGKLSMTITNLNPETTIDLSNLTPGCYVGILIYKNKPSDIFRIIYVN